MSRLKLAADAALAVGCMLLVAGVLMSVLGAVFGGSDNHTAVYVVSAPGLSVRLGYTAVVDSKTQEKSVVVDGPVWVDEFTYSGDTPHLRLQAVPKYDKDRNSTLTCQIKIDGKVVSAHSHKALTLCELN